MQNPPWIKSENKIRVPLNQRFLWEITTKLHPLHNRERDERIVDTVTGEVLARYVDFDTDILGVERGTSSSGIKNYKFWLAVGSCPRGRDKSKWLVDGESFITFQNKIEHINGVMK